MANTRNIANLDLARVKYFQDTYDISEKYGFLVDPNTIPDILPRKFSEFRSVVDAIEDLDGQEFRDKVNALVKGKPQKYYTKLAQKLTTNEKKQIYSLFTFIAQKYVRCMGACTQEDQVQKIPYEIGLIWYECAKEFNLPNVTSYSAVILNNCKLDESGKLVSRHAFSGTSDELHFYKIHMDIEAYGANILNKMFYADLISSNKMAMIELLDNVTSSIKGIRTILLTMYAECKPEVFWTNVRIYLGGYTKDNGLPNGLCVTGTDLKFNFVGGSAAQSTLIQSFDIFLGVEHESEHGKKFLLDQRAYMPQKHQNFLSDLASIYKGQSLKSMVIDYNDEVVLNHYNMAVDALMEFRSSHYKLVHNYVIKFIKNPDINTNNIYGEKGSGSLPTEQLKEFIEDTDRTKLYSFWQGWQQSIWPDIFLFILLIVFSIKFRAPENEYQDPWRNREYFT